MQKLVAFFVIIGVVFGDEINNITEHECDEYIPNNWDVVYGFWNIHPNSIKIINTNEYSVLWNENDLPSIYIIDVDIELKRLDGYSGVIFHATNVTDYLYFGINSDGFAFAQVNQNISEYIKESSDNISLNQVYRLTIKCDGTQFSLYINNILFDSYADNNDDNIEESFGLISIKNDVTFKIKTQNICEYNAKFKVDLIDTNNLLHSTLKSYYKISFILVCLFIIACIVIIILVSTKKDSMKKGYKVVNHDTSDSILSNESKYTIKLSEYNIDNEIYFHRCTKCLILSCIYFVILFFILKQNTLNN